MGIGRSKSSSTRNSKAANAPITLYVAREGDNTFNQWRVPIVFLPGVMGTRLDFPDSEDKEKPKWNPDYKSDMWYWVKAKTAKKLKALKHTQPAVIMHDRTDEDYSADEINRGWSEVAGDFYHGFLTSLSSQQFMLAHCPVYAVGYDWRQEIGDIIDPLKKRIEDILKTENADHGIIITHSMGGLVARAAVKASSALADKILGVVHVVQPAVGSVTAYRRFFTGAKSSYTGLFLSRIIGNTGERYAALMSGLPGPMQLLPSHLYRDRQNRGWLGYMQNGVQKSWAGDVFDLYADPQSPPGLIDHQEYDRLGRGQMKKDLLAGIHGARQFHQWLDKDCHTKTYALYSTDRETDMAVVFDPPVRPQQGKWEDRGAKAQRRDQGDGTVPDTSAGFLFAGQDQDCKAVPEIAIDPCPQQVRVDDVEHGDVFKESQVCGVVGYWIERILFERIDVRKAI